jgi:orotate phosphoribosyltransferase
MEVVSNGYLAKQMKKIGCYIEGDFTLKNNKHTDYYLDVRKIISYPILIKEICAHIYWTYLKDDVNIKLVGVPNGAIPLVSSLSTMFNIPMIILKKERPSHNRMQLIDGIYNKGDKVVVIEDVTITGSSVLQTVQQLSLNGLKTIKVICLFDRGGVNNLHKTVISTFSIFNRIDFKLSIKQKLALMKSRLVFSNDISDKDKFLEELSKVARFISIVKMHSDIIKNIDDAFIAELIFIKNQFNLMIIEDRKFIDSRDITIKQMEHHSIHMWADMVTVHYGNEDTILGVLDTEMDIVLTCNNDASIESVIDIAKKYEKHVVGFLSDSIFVNEFYTFTSKPLKTDTIDTNIFRIENSINDSAIDKTVCMFQKIDQ